MASVGLAATYRTCVVSGCGQTGYVLPIGERVVPLPPDDSPCVTLQEGDTQIRGHRWGPYRPSREAVERRATNATYTRLNFS